MSSGRRGCWGRERSGPTRHTHRPSRPHAKMGSSLARPALWGSQTRVSPDPSDVQKARRLLAGNCQSTEIVPISVYSHPTPNTHHLTWGESIRTGPWEGPKATDNSFWGDGGNTEIQGAEALTWPLTRQVPFLGGFACGGRVVLVDL